MLKLANIGILLGFLLAVSCSTVEKQNSFRMPANSPNVSCKSAVKFFITDLETVETSLAKLSTIPFDSAMEIEITKSKELMSFLDTADGTLKSLFFNDDVNEGIPFPNEVKEWIFSKNLASNELELMSVRFGSLDYLHKVELMKYIGQNKKSTFFKSRRVPGLVIKEKAFLSWDKKTKFLGKTYEAGKVHEVDISNLFKKSLVEYKGPKSIDNFLGVEIHVRTNQFTSGDTSMEGWKFLQGAGIDKKRAHVHVVASLPFEALKENPRLNIAQITDFYRRVNMVAELISIVDKKFRIKSNVSEANMAYWSPLNSENLHYVANYLFRVSSANNPKNIEMGDYAKMAFVGFHGHDKYDSSQKLVYGFQFRSLSRSKQITFRDFLNIVQKNMEEGSYGIPSSRINNWLGDEALAQDVGHMMVMNWYNKSNMDVLLTMPTEIKSNFFEDRLFTDQFFKLSEHNNELKMLVHDWSNDSLIFDNPALKAKILQEQKNALEKIDANQDEDQLKEIVREFIDSTGLYQLFFTSIGGKV